MSAPKRIWATPSDDGWMAPYCGNAPHDGSTEYLRADLCDPMQDERVKRLVGAARRILEDIDDMKEAFDGLAGAWLTTWGEMDPGEPMDAWMEGERMLRAALRALEQGTP